MTNIAFNEPCFASWRFRDPRVKLYSAAISESLSSGKRQDLQYLPLGYLESMFTNNKVHVAERDDASLAKTLSGGVHEPSDPKHFPVLANSAASPRAMSRLQGSFKDTLLTARADEGGSSGQSGESRTEAARGTTKADATRNTSPRISAGRDFTHGVMGAASIETSDWRARERQEVGHI